MRRDSLTTATPHPASMVGRRVKIPGAGGRLYVTHVQGRTLHLLRPSLVDWALGRIFGWWR